MTTRTMTTTVTIPAGGSPYQPIGDQRTATTTTHTTTTTTQSVRLRRGRLFLSGLIQLAFGGLALIPVLILGPLPVTVACCACLAFTGMLGILGSCVATTKARQAVMYDGSTGTQRVVTQEACFPRMYCFLVIVGLCLGIASAIHGIVIIADRDDWDRFDGWSYVFGAVAVGIGIFLALNQMLMICCIAPLVRGSSTTSEHVTSHLVTAGAVPVSSAYQGGHPYAPPTGATGSSTQVYPYIDEPIKEEPPSYNEATRHDNIRPTAPPEKV